MDRRVLALLGILAIGLLAFWLVAIWGPSGPSELESRSPLPQTDATPSAFQLVGEQWRPILGEKNWQENIVEAPDKIPVSDPAAFAQFVTDFNDFPLYWVGLEFQGLPLTSVIRAYYPDVSPPEDFVGLDYGTCTPSSDGGCAPPLQITVTPYCSARPGMYAPESEASDMFKIRGADAQFIAGGLWLWMDTVVVKIAGGPPTQLLEAAEALVAANGSGPRAAGQPFPPLNPDCSDVDLGSYPGT